MTAQQHPLDWNSPCRGEGASRQEVSTQVHQQEELVEASPPHFLIRTLEYLRHNFPWDRLISRQTGNPWRSYSQDLNPSDYREDKTIHRQERTSSEKKSDGFYKKCLIELWGNFNVRVAAVLCCVCVCVCVCVRVRVHVRVCVCIFSSTVKASPGWNKNECNARDQASDVVLRKLFCVKYLRRQVIDNHSRDLKLATVQECQLNRAEPQEIKENSYNFLKINGKSAKHSYLPLH